MFDKIREPIEIPFFDHDKSLFKTIKNSSHRRSQSVLYFSFRKIKNIILYRLAYFCPLNSLRIKMHRWRGVNIGKEVYIAQQVVIDNAYPEYIYIEDYVGVSQGVTLLSHINVRECFNGIIECKVQPIHIKEYALISVNSTILPGVEIGEYAIVSAGSVVISNVKPFTMVIGNPAKKLVNFEHIIKENNHGPNTIY